MKEPVIFTDIIPVTEDNQLYYEMAVKFQKDSERFGTRAQAVNRSKYLKKYAEKRYSLAYETSPCKRLGKLAPESQEFYAALLALLDWQQSWHIEDYWKWYKTQFNLFSFLLKPFSPALAAMMNTLFDMDCSVDEWNESLKLVIAIDLYRLAGKTVQINIDEQNYFLSMF